MGPVNNNQQSLSRRMRIFLLLATIFITGITIVLLLKKQPEITHDALKQEIQSLQNQLPIRVDAYTELMNVEAGEMEIIYSFVVEGDPTHESGISVTDDDFAQQVESAVKNSACINKNTRRYINSNVSLSYRYMNNDNAMLAEFVIPAGYCNK
ncbi:MAG: hypothetical protein OEQ24_02155 [Gammaproteobacteria bacterium]|nr:hypothetical protein [Gammaproteobacteria bacterium]